MPELKTELARLLAEAAGVDVAKIFACKSFAEQSIAAADLKRFSARVAAQYGLPTPNLLWECVSIEALEADLARRLAQEAPGPGPSPPASFGFQEGLPKHLFYD